MESDRKKESLGHMLSFLRKLVVFITQYTADEYTHLREICILSLCNGCVFCMQWMSILYAIDVYFVCNGCVFCMQ